MNTIKQIVFSLTVALSLGGCENSKEEGNSNQAQLPTVDRSNIVIASGKVISGQIYVTNSVPVMPGNPVDIIDDSAVPGRALVTNAIPSNIRWKVPGPFQKPKYPASGFIGFSLYQTQWEAMKAKGVSISIRPSKSKDDNKRNRAARGQSEKTSDSQ